MIDSIEALRSAKIDVRKIGPTQTRLSKVNAVKACTVKVRSIQACPPESRSLEVCAGQVGVAKFGGTEICIS